jgi:hypothetical protein
MPVHYRLPFKVVGGLFGKLYVNVGLDPGGYNALASLVTSGHWVTSFSFSPISFLDQLSPAPERCAHNIAWPFTVFQVGKSVCYSKPIGRTQKGQPRALACRHLPDLNPRNPESCNLHKITRLAQLLESLCVLCSDNL